MTELRKATEAEFDRIYAILHASFPPDERRSHTAQRALLCDPRYTIYVPTGGPVYGFAAVWALEGFTFLEHLAVDEAARNSGLGTGMLAALTRACPGIICLEAELPQTELARRRLDFYRRNGFFVNPQPYEQPAYGPDRHPVPMHLLTSGGPVSREQFHAMRRELYKTVYKRALG